MFKRKKRGLISQTVNAKIMRDSSITQISSNEEIHKPNMINAANEITKAKRDPLYYKYKSNNFNGGILLANEIKQRIETGEIFISEFNEKQLGPNSYNLKLHNELLVYVNDELDMKKENKTKKITIPEEGLVLKPNTLYLGKTVEYTETYGLIPILEGRSSIGRLGIDIHVTAGLGDNGFCGNWTLEIKCVHPVRIYPNCEICQVVYNTGVGKNDLLYNGKYQGKKEISASKMYEDFKK